MGKRFVLLGFCLVLIALAGHASRAQSGVTAEAVGQANLRATPDVNAMLVGQIVAGTRYPVIGRSEFYPWFLLGDVDTAAPLGWVFADLVSVQGDVNTVPFSTVEISTSPLLLTPTIPDSIPTLPNSVATTTLIAPSASTPTPAAVSAVTGTVLGEINIRYGPGVDFPRIGIGRAGDRYDITAYHTQLPWVQIRYAAAPEGVGWVAVELLDIQGDLYSLPSITRTQFNLPTLTPTPSVIQSSSVLGEAPAPLSPAFAALGDTLWAQMLDAGFEIGTSRMGALYLGDLQTGEAITFGNSIAFSGMSLNKIAILAALYQKLNLPPDNAEAITIAEAMICSENISTNELLAIVGDGDPFRGAQTVTNFLKALGLQNTFIVAPYGNDPFITPQPVSAPTTSVDQTSASPDPFNQATVDELGWLLGSVYQCGYGDGGPLLQTFPDDFTPDECRQMLHAMSNNRINAMYESGTPLGTRIAHKHGWIDDTHGDAGVVFTPGGDFVMVTIVHNPQWMDYGESFPLIAELARATYNYYNPDAPVAEIRPGEGAEQCELLGNPLIADLMSPRFEG